MPTEDSTRVRMREMRCLRKTLRDELQQVRKTPFWNSEIDEAVFSLLQKRIAKQGIRSYFLYKVAQYLQAVAEKEGCPLRDIPDPNLFQLTIPFLAETIISVQYYHNQILDGKGGVNTSETINQTLISGNLLRAFAERYVRMRVIDPVIADSLLCCLSKIFELVDVAQYMDKNWGNDIVFQEGLPLNTQLSDAIEQLFAIAPVAVLWDAINASGVPDKHRPFTELYLKRCFLANAPLFMMLSECVMDIMGYTGKERNKVLEFAAGYGILSQLVNDTNDLIPHETIDKKREDAFADLKNGTVTLPYILYLSFAQRQNMNMKKLQRRLHRNSDALFETLLPMIVNVCIPLVIKFAQSLGSNLDIKQGGLLMDMRTLGIVNTHFKEYALRYSLLPPEKQAWPPRVNNPWRNFFGLIRKNFANIYINYLKL